MGKVLISIFIILTFVAMFELFSVYKQAPSPSQKILLLLVTVNLIFVLGYTFSLVSFDEGSYFIATVFEHIGAVYIAFCLGQYACINCGFTIRKWQNVLMMIANLLVVSFFCTDYSFHLMYDSITLNTKDGIVIPNIEHGPLFWTYPCLMLGYFLIVVGLVIYSAFKRKYIFRNRILRKSLLWVLGVTLFIAIGFVIDIVAFSIVDISIIITVIGVAIVIRMNRIYPAYSLKTNTQEDILNKLDDIILVTDKEEGFLFANEACKAYLGEEIANVKTMMPLNNIGPKTEVLLGAGEGEEVTIEDKRYSIITTEADYSTKIRGKIRWFRNITKEHQYITELEYWRNNLANEVDIQTKEVKKRQKEVEELSMQMVITLADAIDAKDTYTKGHSNRVSAYSVLLGRKLGLSESNLDELRYSAILHDVGKIGVPDVILNKPGKLTDTEYGLIKTHTEIGAEILKGTNIIKKASVIARHHHERYDGQGYPDGLRGDDIPYMARIVAIADAYDAMNSSRVYRKKMEREQIREELVRGRGKQFDPIMIDEFIRMFDEGEMVLNTAKDAEEAEESESIAVAKQSGELLKKVMEQITLGTSEEEIDLVTGLLTRNVGERKIFEAMRETKGAFVFFDVDNLKKINDTYGHEAGDAALKYIGQILKSRSNAVACRLGGDEFLAFFREVSVEEIQEIVSDIIAGYLKLKDENPTTKVASVSAGIVMTDTDSVYDEIYNHADKALYHVKQNGKAGYYMYGEKEKEKEDDYVDINLLQKSITQSGFYKGAMDVEYRQFTKLYEYTKNICERYNFELRLVMVTLLPKQKGSVAFDENETAMKYLEQSIVECIRNVDIFTRYGKNKYILICLNANDEQIDTLVKRVISRYYKICGNGIFEPIYEVANTAKDNILENGEII